MHYRETGKVVISLFDNSGTMALPWAENGYECWIVDIQHRPGLDKDDSDFGYAPINRIGADIRDGWEIPEEIQGRVAFVSAFPPCDHLAVSGARWFKGKGLRALEEAIALFATAAEVCEASGAPYLIENPVSTISTYWRKPDYSFSPHQYTGYAREDNFTKKTCLWTGGGFVMPEPYQDPLLGDPDDRIHKAGPGPQRKNFRSATPAGFAKAVYESNSQI
jgi:hypothetical protein